MRTSPYGFPIANVHELLPTPLRVAQNNPFASADQCNVSLEELQEQNEELQSRTLNDTGILNDYSIQYVSIDVLEG